MAIELLPVPLSPRMRPFGALSHPVRLPATSEAAILERPCREIHRDKETCVGDSRSPNSSFPSFRARYVRGRHSEYSRINCI